MSGCPEPSVLGVRCICKCDLLADFQVPKDIPQFLDLPWRKDSRRLFKKGIDRKYHSDEVQPEQHKLF